MNVTTFICVVAAFVIGVVVGWITIAIPSGGRTNISQEDARRLNRLIDRAWNMDQDFTITLWSEGAMVDKVTVKHDMYYR